MMEELKQCPFCGSGNVHVVDAKNGENSVECGDCCAVGPWKDEDVEAVAAWNRRAPESRDE